MPTGTQNSTIEGFVIDKAFVNQSENTNDLFPTNTANVGELSANGLSYFVNPTAIKDRRAPGDRSVNWAAETAPQIILDEAAYPAFITAVNSLPNGTLASLFRIVDKLMFDYEAGVSHATVESLLTTDTGTKDVYVANSFALSALIVSDTVYTDNGTPKTVAVPSYVTFDIVVPSGSTTQTFVLKLYTSIAAWLVGYSRSEISEVVPPLPYAQLYNASLGTATDNIFSTASLTAKLSYNTLQARLKNMLVSGMVEYNAVLVDTANEVSVPFNILYKGRAPTLFEIRNAIKEELLTSGVGDEAGWKRRLPGVFITGRFYIVPLWDKFFEKPDQLVYPNVINYNGIADTADKILGTLGYSDITQDMDVMTLYYNHMSAVAVPDRSGALQIARLSDVFPDYQSFPPNSERYAYMQETTQSFVRQLNTVMAIDSQAQTSSIYGPNTEGVLSFYSYTAGSYEICVITKICFETVMESEL